METIPLSIATLIINALGLSGLIFIIWHFDNKRFQRQAELRSQEMAQEKVIRMQEMTERERAIASVLQQYHEDVIGIKRLYESNVHLVQDYEKTCTRIEAIVNELMGVISLNSQVYTRLTEAIEHNMFCPILRERGAHG